MSFADNILKNLFNKKQGSVILYEPLIKSDKEKIAFEKEIKTGVYSRLLKNLKADFYNEDNPYYTWHKLNNGQVYGLVLEGAGHLGKDEFIYLFNHVERCCLNLGYGQAVNDKKIIDQKSNIEETLRYILKPPVSSTVPGDQIFGNVAIEYITIDKIPKYLKVLVTPYQDRSYSKPRSYDEFLDIIFEVPVID